MKLTLNISDAGLIERMKDLAKKRNTSLSQITEGFFKKEVENDKQPYQMKQLDELPEFIRHLCISGDPVPDFDHKAEYGKHLEEKYGL